MTLSLKLSYKKVLSKHKIRDQHVVTPYRDYSDRIHFHRKRSLLSLRLPRITLGIKIQLKIKKKTLTQNKFGNQKTQFFYGNDHAKRIHVFLLLIFNIVESVQIFSKQTG